MSLRSMVLLLMILFSSARSAVAFDPFQAAGIDPHPGAQVPLDRVFYDQDNHAVTLRQLGAGKPMLLVPVLHRCPNLCGVTLAGLLQAIDMQTARPGRDFTLIAFGIDPKEAPTDGAASLQRLRQSFPALAGRVTAVTGDATNIAAVLQALGYRYGWDAESGQYAHIAATAVLNPAGQLTRWLYGVAPQPRDLSLAVTEAGQTVISTWEEQFLLLCFHYDPQNGRYDNAIWRSVQIGGYFVVAFGGLLICLALCREWQWASGKAKGKGHE